jgi:hypothetical protein
MVCKINGLFGSVNSCTHSTLVIKSSEAMGVPTKLKILRGPKFVMAVTNCFHQCKFRVIP